MATTEETNTFEPSEDDRSLPGGVGMSHVTVVPTNFTPEETER
jgi:hypothetical protein